MLYETPSPALCVGCHTVWTRPPLSSAEGLNSDQSIEENPYGHWESCRSAEAEKKTNEHKC